MATGILSAIFGLDGGATSVFSGMWYLAGIFILLFFIFYLYGANVSAENIVFFGLAFILLIISYGLFDVPTELIISVVMFIGLFLTFYVYNIFYKPD